MDILQATALEKEIDRQLLERAEGIMEELTSRCENTDSMENLFKDDCQCGHNLCQAVCGDYGGYTDWFWTGRSSRRR